MNKRELLQTVLERIGYTPEIDSDGDLIIRYQMKYISILVGDEDEPFVSVILPHFYEIEDNQESLVLATCNKLTRELKIVKVFVNQSFKSVAATVEFLYTDEKSLEQSLRYSLQILGVVRSAFRKNMAELEK